MTERIRFACRITETADTLSEYEKPVAFPLQQWSCDRASMLRYTYVACLVTQHLNTRRPVQYVQNNKNSLIFTLQVRRN